MGPRIPIDAALWERMRALDVRCDFFLERIDANAPDPKGLLSGRRNFDRMWRVRIIPRGRPERAVTCEAARLRDALEGATRTAEGMTCAWQGDR